jgi:hypothetical protein
MSIQVRDEMNSLNIDLIKCTEISWFCVVNQVQNGSNRPIRDGWGLVIDVLDRKITTVYQAAIIWKQRWRQVNN